MSGVLEDTAEVLRQLQKLNKELNPVKSALTALAKRENTSPNAQAAATSLEKVAARVADVSTKYRPFMMRMGQLLENDVPSTMLQTAFMAAPASRIAADVEAYRRREEARSARLRKRKAAQCGMRTAGATAAGPDEEGDGSDDESSEMSEYGSRGKRHSDEDDRSEETAQPRRDSKATPPASLLSEVCPTSPFLVPPEYYQHYHDQLKLRVEMVEYLLATGRPEVARHVAASYGLPLVWFPSLTAAAMLAGSAVTPATGPGSPSLRNGSMVNASFLSSSSPLITPALPPRSNGLAGSPNGSAGMPPTSPVQLPAPVATAAGGPVSPLVDSISSVTGRASGALPPRVGTQAFLDEMPTSTSAQPTLSTPVQQPQQQRPPTSMPGPRPSVTVTGPSSPPLRHASESSPLSGLTNDARTSGNVPAVGRGSGLLFQGPGAGDADTAKKPLPDLVTRVVAAAVLLKDEYLDRMVLERLIENDGFAPAWAEDDARDRQAEEPTEVPHDNEQPSASWQERAVRTALGNVWRPPHLSPPGSGQQRELRLGRFTPPPFRDARGNGRSQPETGGRRASVMEKDLYEEAVVETARRVTRSHICTQSGSTQFDDAMMNVIEEMLASALDHHREKNADIGTTSAAGDAVAAQQQRSQKTSHRRLLTPDELLAAEEAFSNDILFIKRPTRYYCVHTSRIMDGSGEGGTFPRVLPNGMIIADSAITEELSDARVLSDAPDAQQGVQFGVVCPPSEAFFTHDQLKRIFVT